MINANKSTQPDRLERVARGLLALALITAVSWAWTNDGGLGWEFLGRLRG
ncbi:MAG: hypothetical protein KY442_08585 [Proteobacteria bacterium]|nr:hypothetical protein [Pseudomonadota bacterium]